MPPPRLKRSNTAGQVPASLADGEIAINQADGKLFYQTAAGGVSTFLATPTAHKSSHATGGSDALSAADIGALTQTVADGRYVNVTGDTMTGGLAINAATPLSVTGGRTFLAANGEPYGLGVRHHSSGGAVYFGATDATSTPGARISNSGGAALMSFTNAGAASIPGTLTVGGNAAVVTTDSRLSDSRAPTAHNSTHATGGTDALAPADIGAFSSSGGTIAGNVQIGAGGLSGLRYLDVTNTDAGAGSGSIVRIISMNVDGSAASPVNLVKYKNGLFAISNVDLNSAACITLGVGHNENLRIASTGVVGVGTASPTLSSGVGVHIAGSTFRLSQSRTPASSTATGNTGEICWDSSYLYVCVATNTWRRLAHSTW
jgi:hypothetical protein